MHALFSSPIRVRIKLPTNYQRLVIFLVLVYIIVVFFTLWCVWRLIGTLIVLSLHSRSSSQCPCHVVLVIIYFTSIKKFFLMIFNSALPIVSVIDVHLCHEASHSAQSLFIFACLSSVRISLSHRITQWANCLIVIRVASYLCVLASFCDFVSL